MPRTSRTRSNTYAILDRGEEGVKNLIAILQKDVRLTDLATALENADEMRVARALHEAGFRILQATTTTPATKSASNQA